MTNYYPLARTKDLVVQAFENETLVYDLETNTAHHLNKTAADVWSMCDGKSSLADIERKITVKFRQITGEDFVRLAIDHLNEVRLLQNAEEMTQDSAGMSRRRMIRRADLASIIALPLVSSLVAPKAAASDAVCGTVCAEKRVCNSSNCPNCVGDFSCGGSHSTCTRLGDPCRGSAVCEQAYTCAGTSTPCTPGGDTCGFWTCIANGGICPVDQSSCTPGTTCNGSATCNNTADGRKGYCQA